MIRMIRTKVVRCFVVVDVFTLNRSFYPTTSAVLPVSFLIPHPRGIQIVWSDRFLWEQKVAKKVKVLWQLLVGNFGQ